MTGLTHIDESGRARMVDVSDKEESVRIARARGLVVCDRETLERVRSGQAPKGSVLQTAEIAGVMAAKRTSELIPLCHPLLLTKAEVRIEMDDGIPGFVVLAEVRTKAVTGVEMEALTAASIACLTLFDMLKAIDRAMTIGGIQLLSKTGGKSGDWKR